MTMEDPEQPTDVTLADPPGVDGAKQPTQSETFGIRSGGSGGQESVVKPLYAVSAEFAEWAVRGYRTEEVARAEVEISAENRALYSESFPLRADMMGRFLEADAYKGMFRPKAPAAMTPLEFWGLFTFGIVILSIIGIIALVYVG